MDDAHVGHLDAHLVAHLAGAVDGADEQVIGGQSGRLVAEGHHLSGERVELGVRRESLALPAAVKIPRSDGLQGIRIDLVGQSILLGGEQFPGMHHRRGVGHRAQVGMFRVAHRRIIRVRIAVIAVELVAGFTQFLQAPRVHEAALEIHLAALEAETAHVAIGIEDGIVGKLRRVVPLVAGAEEGPVQILRDLAHDLAILDRDVKSQRRIEAASRQALRVIRHIAPLPCLNHERPDGRQFTPQRPPLAPICAAYPESGNLRHGNRMGR